MMQFNIFVKYNITDPLIVIYLFHINRYFHFYLKYYADFNWVCLVCTCIVDVLILDKHCYAFCQLKNSGRIFIVKPKANTFFIFFVYFFTIMFTYMFCIHPCR